MTGKHRRAAVSERRRRPMARVARRLEAAWSRNGRELFFLTPDLSHIAAMPIGAGRRLRSAAPRRSSTFGASRWRCQPGSGDVGRTYDVSPDGQRFLVFAPVDNRREEIVVVDHWMNELKSAKR